MPAPPLTHHDILTLIEPFARRGRQIDLGASQRAERQLRFKPIDHAATAALPALPALRELLQLDVFDSGGFRLTRTLARSDGLQATLQATGDDCAALLERFDAVAPALHFVDGPGFAIARSFEFEAAGGTVPLLSRGVVQVDGLSLSIDVPAVRGLPAELTLLPAPGERLALPDDVLAVIGWDWARLVEKSEGWSSKLRLRGGRARRGATAERALLKAARHLARLVAEPPRRYHERHVWARWGVVLRRMIPTLTALGMIAAAANLPRVSEGQAPGWWLAMHYLSIGLLAFSFCLQELPRFEIPAPPRRARMPAWRSPAPAAVALSSGEKLSSEQWPATR